MRVTSVTFSKLYNLGNYNNERLEVTVELESWDNVRDAFLVARGNVQDAFDLAHAKPTGGEEEDIPF